MLPLYRRRLLEELNLSLQILRSCVCAEFLSTPFSPHTPSFSRIHTSYCEVTTAASHSLVAGACCREGASSVESGSGTSLGAVRSRPLHTLPKGAPAGYSSKRYESSLLRPDRELTEHEYDHAIDVTLEDIFSALETLLDQQDIPNSDLELSEGVIKIELGDHGTYVLNKQAPNRQLWMSSPVSGPVRYDFCNGHWVYLKDGHDLHRRLTDELSRIFGPIKFEPSTDLKRG